MKAKLMAIILAFILVGCGALVACGGTENTSDAKDTTTLSVSDKMAPETSDASASPEKKAVVTDGQLVEEDGEWAYYVDGKKASKLGVDVATYQGSIDWQAVAADGIEFAMVRIGQNDGGTFSLDPYYESNVAGAQAAGLEVGVYFYSCATDEQTAQDEARYVLDNLAGRSLELPVVFDCEYGLTGLCNSMDASTMTAAADAFCQTIIAGGYEAMVYGNADDFACYARTMSDSYATWFADFGASEPCATFPITIWQYSCSGSVNGIPNIVDRDLLFTCGPVSFDQ